MRALITGGAGFIGSHLAEELLRRGEEVCVVDDLSTGMLENLDPVADDPHLQVRVETVLNESAVDELVADCDVVYHLAAAVGVELIISRPIEVVERNVLGTSSVMRAASRHRKRLILASSSEVYGKDGARPLREDDDRLLGPTTKKRWSYSCTKALGEYLSLAYHEHHGLDAVTVRLFNAIGPRQTGRYGMVVPRFLGQARSGQAITVYGDGQQVRCFAYVSDVVRGMIELVREPAASGGIFNLGSDQPISILDLAKKVKALTGSHSEIRLVSYGEAYEAGFEDMERRIPDLSRITALTGYRPTVDLDEALRRVMASLR